MAKILWMDNDRVFLWPHVVRLEDAGHNVTRAYSVSEAEDFLRKEKDWDLVIIDPMMNVSEEEEEDYPPSETDNGLKAGLVFYRRMRDLIKEMGAHPLVFTMRDDADIYECFQALELDGKNIMYKMDVSDTADFLGWVDSFIERKEGESVQLAK